MRRMRDYIYVSYENYVMASSLGRFWIARKISWLLLVVLYDIPRKVAR